MTEPRENFSAGTTRPKELCVEGEWRLLVRGVGDASQILSDVRTLALQRRKQTALPVPGKLEQLVVVEAEKRALEHGRQREIVVRQQQCIGERHQVHHGDMLGQHQPVGARNRNAVIFQRPDDRLEQRAAAADKDEHVSREPSLRTPGSHRAGDPPRQPDRTAGDRLGVERRGPPLLGFGLVRLLQVPDFNEAGHRPGQRLMHRRVPAGGQAGAGGFGLEHGIHRLQHVGAGAKRMLELSKDEIHVGVAVRACEVIAIFRKLGRHRTLEREDRLLLVADREDRARPVVRPETREELADQRIDDGPLLWARILCFVDQHVMDAAVELVVHPGSRHVVEQFERLVDQVLIVEQPAPVLLGTEALDHRVGDGEQGDAAVARLDGAAVLDERPDAILLLGQPGAQVRIGVLDGLGREPGAFLFLPAGAEDFEIGLQPVRAGKPAQRRKQCALIFVAGALALVERGRNRRPFRRGDDGIVEKHGVDLTHRFVRLDAEGLRKLGHRLRHPACRLDPGHQHITPADRLAHQFPERHVGGSEDRCGERPAERAVRLRRGLQHHAEAQLLEQLCFGGLVEHLEARRHVGFERKQMQQLGAEGVDGVHLETARRLERERKQLPRASPERSGGPTDACGLHRRVEACVIEPGPFAQFVEHPVRHIGGGRLGEGDAENARRVDPGQQQPDHALRQHVGLAGAGIGRDKGGMGRIRCFDLQVGDSRGDLARRVHSPPP